MTPIRLLALLALLHGLLPAADTILSVGASGGAGPISSTWSLVAKPIGAADPQILQEGPTPTDGVTDTAIARFADQAVPGTYRFQVVVSDGTTTLAPSVVEVVVQRSQVITFPTLAERTPLDLVPFSAGATSSSGLAVVLTSDTPAVATIVNGFIQLTGTVGTATITARQPGTATIAPASAVTAVLTVRKATQTISFPALASATVGDSDRVLGATASSGLPVTYTSLAPSVATIVDGRLRIIGPGTVVIRATQGGDAVWAAAATVERTVTIGRSTTPLVITLPARATPATLVLP